MKISCFISHNSKDKQFARKLAHALHEAGIEPWIDEWNIFAGESISGKVQAAISSCDYFVIILSPNSIGSNWVREELRAALTIRLATKSDFILPILLQECEIPPFLQDYKYLDFSHSFQVPLSDLIRAIKRSPSPIGLLSVRQIREETVLIPRGDFHYSHTNKITPLSYSFRIDKYPVSRRKFLSFVFSGDLRRREFWHDRAWNWMVNVAWKGIDLVGEQELLTKQYQHLFSNPEELDYPIAYLTAYEAEAYCCWVGGRLPKDIEWDKAAHGTDRRAYPWGSRFIKGRCHTEGNMRFRVDDYPKGASPYGVFNMAGFKAEFIGELAAETPSDLQDDILTRGWIGYWNNDVITKLPKYSILGRAGCFPVSAQGHPITFRCVYPLDSPYDSIFGQYTTQQDLLDIINEERKKRQE